MWLKTRIQPLSEEHCVQLQETADVINQTLSGNTSENSGSKSFLRDNELRQHSGGPE